MSNVSEIGNKNKGTAVLRVVSFVVCMWDVDYFQNGKEAAGSRDVVFENDAENPVEW